MDQICFAAGGKSREAALAALGNPIPIPLLGRSVISTRDCLKWASRQLAGDVIALLLPHKRVTVTALVDVFEYEPAEAKKAVDELWRRVVQLGATVHRRPSWLRLAHTRTRPPTQSRSPVYALKWRVRLHPRQLPRYPLRHSPTEITDLPEGGLGWDCREQPRRLLWICHPLRNRFDHSSPESRFCGYSDTGPYTMSYGRLFERPWLGFSRRLYKTNS